MTIEVAPKRGKVCTIPSVLLLTPGTFSYLVRSLERTQEILLEIEKEYDVEAGLAEEMRDIAYNVADVSYLLSRLALIISV